MSDAIGNSTMKILFILFVWFAIGDFAHPTIYLVISKEEEEKNKRATVINECADSKKIHGHIFSLCLYHTYHRVFLDLIGRRHRVHVPKIHASIRLMHLIY